MKKKIEKFEQLIAWQKARKLTSQIYRVTNEGRFAKDFGLRDQVRRAAVSTTSNLAEGFERGSLPEFQRFLSISKGSCAELRTQLYIALDVGYLDKDSFMGLMGQAIEVGQIIGGLRAGVERRRAKESPKLQAKQSII
ncbi:MAG TPA: four helix bundle protein [Pyrinomonadaceae bacterium]|nr:four helix bundle protein [Pyrinomonadaceae bacterium]